MIRRREELKADALPSWAGLPERILWDGFVRYLNDAVSSGE
jgi:hypothetical protein